MQPPTQCDPINIWRPVPDNSSVKVSVSGDESVFDVRLNVAVAGRAPKKFKQADLVPGPAVVPFDSTDHGGFNLVLNITDTPPQGKPVIVDIRIVDENDVVVMVSDGEGGKRPARCASKFTEATGSTSVGIVLVAIGG